MAQTPSSQITAYVDPLFPSSTSRHRSFVAIGSHGYRAGTDTGTPRLVRLGDVRGTMVEASADLPG